MIKMFKKADGFGIESVIEHKKFHWLYKTVGKCSSEKPSDKLATSITPEPPKLSREKPNSECNLKDGVFVESKNNHLRELFG
jgi:hypothetical protein